MKKKKLKCYIYIRVSTSMQVEGYSLEAQRERLTKFADFQDIEIVREYCDAGKSGKNITGRPEFSQMLNDVAEIVTEWISSWYSSFRDSDEMRRMSSIPFSTYRISV